MRQSATPVGRPRTINRPKASSASSRSGLVKLGPVKLNLVKLKLVRLGQFELDLVELATGLGRTKLSHGQTQERTSHLARAPATRRPLAICRATWVSRKREAHGPVRGQCGKRPGRWSERHLAQP